MQISPITPPYVTLPVEPMPPSSMADEFVADYGSQLRALGATDVQVVDSKTVSAVFNNNFAGTQASGALNDVIGGVKLLVDNRSMTADYWTVTGDNVATWLGQSSLVEKVESRETFPVQLAVFGTSGRAESALADLLRTQLDDGTQVAVQRRMWAL